MQDQRVRLQNPSRAVPAVPRESVGHARDSAQWSREQASFESVRRRYEVVRAVSQTLRAHAPRADRPATTPHRPPEPGIPRTTAPAHVVANKSEPVLEVRRTHRPSDGRTPAPADVERTRETARLE